MASQKRPLSSASESEARTKVPKLSLNEDSVAQAEDGFTIEVKLRSTSKAAANDPRPRMSLKEAMEEIKKKIEKDMPSGGALPAASTVGSGDKPTEVEALKPSVQANLR
jgi:hypothetical protein